MSLTPSLRQRAVNELASQRCICGRGKQRNHSFCRRCYFSLPENLKHDLWKSFSDGYAEAYDEARDWLLAQPEPPAPRQESLL